MECKAGDWDNSMQYGADLIDTLWNVKYDGIVEISGSVYGFNRYIVECKDRRF